MQQQHFWRLWIAGFTVEDVETLDFDGFRHDRCSCGCGRESFLHRVAPSGKASNPLGLVFVADLAHSQLVKRTCDPAKLGRCTVISSGAAYTFSVGAVCASAASGLAAACKAARAERAFAGTIDFRLAK